MGERLIRKNADVPSIDPSVVDPPATKAAHHLGFLPPHAPAQIGERVPIRRSGSPSARYPPPQRQLW